MSGAEYPRQRQISRPRVFMRSVMRRATPSSVYQGLFRRRSESFASHGGYRAALTTPTLRLVDSEISHTCIKWKALEPDIVQAKHLFDCCGFACEISVANFVENDNRPFGHLR